MALFFFFFFCLLIEQNFGYIYILYKKESNKLNSCEWFLDRPVHFLNEWISVMGLHSVGTETSRYPQVFHALTSCKRDPWVLGCHTQGMHNVDYPHHIYSLHKAIYEPSNLLELGTRSSASTFLLSLGFVTSCADSSLFVYSRSNALLYFLVYVDDLIITYSDPSLVNTIIRQLDSKFSTKDLGALSYFSGVEVLATSTGLLLSQQKYVIDLLSKHIMLNSKLVSI